MHNPLGALQANTVPAPSLRRAGSQFLDVDGLSVHFACTAPCRQDSRGHRRPPKRAMHLCHGFGANLFSFEPCRTKLADVLEATVTAHDMPAFGLTDRLACPLAGPLIASAAT